MKHPYSIPNHSKEDTLYKARETLKRYTVVSPLYGTITLYKLMRKFNAQHTLILKAWIPNRDDLRRVQMIHSWEVPTEAFESAMTLVTEWGYDSKIEIMSWGVRLTWDKFGLRKGC